MRRFLNARNPLYYSLAEISITHHVLGLVHHVLGLVLVVVLARHASAPTSRTE